MSGACGIGALVVTGGAEDLWQMPQNDSGSPAWLPGYGTGPEEPWQDVHAKPPGIGCDTGVAAGSGKDDMPNGEELKA